MKFTRRTLLRATAAGLATPALGTLAPRALIDAAAAQPAAGPDWRHGLSLFGAVKYPAGFKHFDYVNPAAPQAAPCACPASAPSTISTRSWRW